MLKKLSYLMEYVAWLYKKSYELQQSAILRIIEIKEINGDVMLLIQVVNKTAILKCKPEEIVNNENLLGCFSKNDIKTIVFYATKAEMAPPFQIISYCQWDEKKGTLFKIRNQKTQEILELSTFQISKNKKLIKNFKSEDAHKIGYITAIDQDILEKKQVNE